MRLLTNRAECAKCGDIIESKYRHDYQACSCGEIFVDGGRDYQHRGVATDLTALIDRSEHRDV